jgi:ribose 5-phosphate isomerase B
MKLIIGSDHRGFHIKLVLQERLRKHNGQTIEWLDAGCFSAERCDYPPFAEKVARAVLAKEADGGILLCGSGVGVSIVANRFPGIYAALVWNEALARLAKEDDNANILALPADSISSEEAIHLIQAWLGATFKGGRYQQRLLMIESMDIGSR